MLMAVMDSLAVWTMAAHDTGLGLAWRDALTARMRAAGGYVAYEDLVVDTAADLGLPMTAHMDLRQAWAAIEPWPDAAAIVGLAVPYAFVTNCSADLAAIAAARSRLAPRFVLSAEEAGAYKPAPAVYLEACRRLGTRPERSLFVAGAPYDADGARDAGLRAVFVQRRADLDPPDAAIPTVDSLANVVASIGRTGATDR
jgi:2-haloalkanoic acid dehalogenase type II